MDISEISIAESVHLFMRTEKHATLALLLRKCFFVPALRIAAGGSTVLAGHRYPLQSGQD